MLRILLGLCAFFFSVALKAGGYCSDNNPLGREACKNENCVWDETNQCLDRYLISSDCHLSTEEGSCKELGCTWAHEQKKCVKSPGFFCSSRYDAKSCQESWGCVWQTADNRCLNTRAWGRQACKEAKEDTVCSAISGCLWDTGGKKCLNNGYISKSFCGAAKEEKTCHTLSAKNRYCHWDNKSGCFENDICVLAQSADSCSKVSGNCSWESEKNLCLPNTSSSCEFASEENCNKSFNRMCSWDARSKICVANERVSKSFKELDTKTKAIIDQFLANNSIEESHLFKFDSSLCYLHNEPAGCRKSTDCTWDKDHLSCIDIHTSVCGYVGKSACGHGKTFHCVWDDVAHTCFRTSQSCAYFKSHDLCKDRCTWDKNGFCREKTEESEK